MTFAKGQAVQPEIGSGRLRLRLLRDADAPLIEHYANDRRVSEMTTTIPFPLPAGAAQALVGQAHAPGRTEDFWAIDTTASEGAALVGLISLVHLDADQSEVGYWIAPPFWNRGFAQEALAALVAANPHRNRTLFASVFQDNPVSARVLANCGFVYLGDAEAWSVARGVNVPSWTYLRQMTI